MIKIISHSIDIEETGLPVTEDTFFKNKTTDGISETIYYYPETRVHGSKHGKGFDFLTRNHNQTRKVTIVTHSEHIINHVCIRVKMGTLNPEDIIINHYNEEGCHDINISEDGRLSKRPKGFFDQMDKDLRILMSTTKKS